MNEPLVIITNLSKNFDHQKALEKLSAQIPKGQIIGLAGPDGAGKTTLIRLMAGLLKPTSGKITINGLDTIENAEALHNIVSYMPQKFGLYEDLSVIQNLRLYADLQGVVGEEKNAAFEKLLRFTGLSPFQDRLAKNLSGGMKQKLGLACVLIRKPTLLLLDEPSVGVDPLSRRELWKMVQNLQDQGISVVWSTAYLDEAEKCSSVLLLNEGKLLFAGPPQELTQRVKGRTFLITNIEGNKRQILRKVLKASEVIDAVIQGSEVRFVTHEPLTPPFELSVLQSEKDLQVKSTAPRFEDAFIDLLGGIRVRTSFLAEKTPKVSTESDHLIEADQLTKRFGDFTAADQITFKEKSGEIFGLLGPNGAGKTTTFKMLCGLLTPTSGKAFVMGFDLQVAPSQARSQIGYMAQKFSLYGDLTVFQNLEFFSGIYNLTGKAKKQAVQEMIEIFDLKPYLNVPSGMLPLGFKQRLALSCAVMHRPGVLFLDEPTSGVDPISRREFWTHINGLVEKGVTVMVTTHFMDEAEHCDRIALIYQSKIIKMGSPDALKEAAKTKENPSPSLEDAFVQLIERWDLEK